MPIFATGDLDGIPGAALPCFWTFLPQCSSYRVCMYLVPFPDVHASAGAEFGIVASLVAQSPCCPSLDGTSMDPTVHLIFVFWICSRHGSALDAVPVLFGWLGTMADPCVCSLHLTRGPWNRFGTLETEKKDLHPSHELRVPSSVVLRHVHGAFTSW